jgi:hypothetical protein
VNADIPIAALVTGQIYPQERGMTFELQGVKLFPGSGTNSESTSALGGQTV